MTELVVNEMISELCLYLINQYDRQTMTNRSPPHQTDTQTGD